ncbi:MAG: DUF3800 domain-containing protein [Terracidiphilus sp.]
MRPSFVLHSYMALPFVDEEPILSFIHVYCDESGKHKNDSVVSFAALCVRVAALDTFNAEWEVLLRQYGLEELHMSQISRLSQNVGCRFVRGQTASERVELLKPFVDRINGYMETGFVHATDSAGFSSIPEKQKKALANMKDPYHLAFIRGLAALSKYGRDERLAIVCDDDEETAWDSYEMYRALRRPQRAVRDKVKSLSFADSVAFPALQATDMISYLGRKEGELLWYSKPYDFRELLAYVTHNQTPGRMQWKVAWIDKTKLQNAKNWRVTG